MAPEYVSSKRPASFILAKIGKRYSGATCIPSPGRPVNRRAHQPQQSTFPRPRSRKARYRDLAQLAMAAAQNGKRRRGGEINFLLTTPNPERRGGRLLLRVLISQRFFLQQNQTCH